MTAAELRALVAAAGPCPDPDCQALRAALPQLLDRIDALTACVEAADAMRASVPISYHSSGEHWPNKAAADYDAARAGAKS